MATCEHCGAEFDRPRMGRPKKFCQDSCRLAAHNARRQSASRSPRPKKGFKVIPGGKKKQDGKQTKPTPIDRRSAEAEAWKNYVLEHWELNQNEIRLLDLACDAWDMYQRAKKVIDEEGLTITCGRWNDKAMERPEVKIMERSRKDFAAILKQLNLPPIEDDMEEFGEELGNG